MVQDTNGRGNIINVLQANRQEIDFDLQLKAKENVKEVIGLMKQELDNLEKALATFQPSSDDTDSTYPGQWNNFLSHLPKYNEQLKQILIIKQKKR